MKKFLTDLNQTAREKADYMADQLRDTSMVLLVMWVLSFMATAGSILSVMTTFGLVEVGSYTHHIFSTVVALFAPWTICIGIHGIRTSSAQLWKFIFRDMDQSAD